MMHVAAPPGLETKYCAFEPPNTQGDTLDISGYASIFGIADRGGDIVKQGAFAASLQRLAGQNRQIKMLWQHDPAQPIGVWDVVEEDGRGLRVSGRLLTEIARAREASALMQAGVLDGLSIGYRTVRAEKSGAGRIIHEIELWEVSLVTFPMLPEATVHPEGAADAAVLAHRLTDIINSARAKLP